MSIREFTLEDFGGVGDYFLPDGATLNPDPTDNWPAWEAALTALPRNYQAFPSGKISLPLSFGGDRKGCRSGLPGVFRCGRHILAGAAAVSETPTIPQRIQAW